MQADLLHQLLRPRPVRYFETTTSTNSDASAWLADVPALADGAVVIANEQTQGRGRLGRSWLTPPGSAIAMSLILRRLATPYSATMIGAVAVAETLEAFAPGQVALKWSNDVQINGRKVCGVLAEGVWQGDQLQAVILGCGINIAVDFRGTELAATAASLQDFSTTPIEREPLIQAILQRVDHWQAATPSTLFLAWKNRLATLGKTINVYIADQVVSGVAVDVDTDGALLVETDQGVQRFLAGDVTIRNL